MRAKGNSIWLNRIALLMLFAVSAVSSASAQTPPPPDLETVLVPGMTAWITDRSGREEKTRVVDVSADVVTATIGESTRSLQTTDIIRVRARHSDSVLNGALIGAGAAVAAGLLLCTTMEPWENCRDDVGPIVGIGAIGAGIGIGIDALIRGRRTIYDARAGSAGLYTSPIIARGAAGLRISLVF